MDTGTGISLEKAQFWVQASYKRQGVQGRAVRAADVADSNSNWPSLPLYRPPKLTCILYWPKKKWLEFRYYWESAAFKNTIMFRERLWCRQFGGRVLKLKHCQRHNGPKGWVLLTKVTPLGQITSSYTNLDQISSFESRPSINFKILTIHQHLD